jgi:secreted trypsin-like serine protease
MFKITQQVIVLCAFIALSAEAIVIRHDVDDAQYLAKPADFPALATFYIDGAHGTLIEPKWVVTAAHATFCVIPGSLVKINGVARSIKQLYVHKNYTPGKSHDIALVELHEPVLDVKPAILNKSEHEQGKNVWFIGIGGTGNGLAGETIDNAKNNGVLRKSQNTIVKADGPLIKFVFNQGENALPLEGVSGGGDSGGPAFIKNNDHFTLLGISSRPEGNFSAIGVYGIKEVYSRVSYFQTWISSIIAGDRPNQQKLSMSKLVHLPAGLSEDILPSVCKDIGIKN